MDIENFTEIHELWKERVRLDGKDKALRKAKEELSELLVAISHYEDGKENEYRILDEMVDVSLQCEKLIVMFDKNDFTAKQRQKKYDYLESITY